MIKVPTRNQVFSQEDEVYFREPAGQDADRLKRYIQKAGGRGPFIARKVSDPEESATYLQRVMLARKGSRQVIWVKYGESDDEEPFWVSSRWLTKTL